ncbi:GspE/PulE family protein [Sulfuricystis multivorans]|uniref:GspE/PulE family protein n=1 Tax=Sulfuricystis multivorans TaxID=2211108 RepID=UPI001558B92B|nr:ATPase, T2SS/T4P/T4SS family [Sulfuricystis multivorans]
MTARLPTSLATPPRAAVLQMPARVPDGLDTDALMRLVQDNLEAARRQGASDVHFEATGLGLVVRQRIDGVLETVCELAGREIAAQAIARLKTLLGIVNGAVREGHGEIRLNGLRVPVRLSILSGRHGEDAILSIRDKPRLVPAGEALEIERLGFASTERAHLHALAAQPYGLVLVAGPSGSGRTTTLYAMLAECDGGREKTICIEASAGPAMPGILQTAVVGGRQGGMSAALRAALRHDPDRIAIDPLIDAASAELALTAAQDGRRVLAAVGGNHVLDALNRFLHFGVDATALGEALNGIVAQRLLRTVCPHCAEPVVPSAAELAALALPTEAAIGAFRRGRGCGACRTTGYLGRRAIAEILVLDEGLRTLIIERAPLATIKAEARRQGMHSLREAALQLARAGLTTLDEVARVTRQV